MFVSSARQWWGLIISFFCQAFLVRVPDVIMIICGCSTYWDVAGVVGLLVGRMANLGLGES